MVSHHVLKAILSKDNHVTLVTKRKCLLLWSKLFLTETLAILNKF
jgi:hypothetical protein